MDDEPADEPEMEMDAEMMDDEPLKNQLHFQKTKSFKGCQRVAERINKAAQSQKNNLTNRLYGYNKERETSFFYGAKYRHKTLLLTDIFSTAHNLCAVSWYFCYDIQELFDCLLLFGDNYEKQIHMNERFIYF